MVLNCTACKSRYKPGLSFHKFPFNRPNTLAAWIKFVNRGPDWSPNKSSSLCGQHFTRDSFASFPDAHRVLLNEDAVPTIVIQPTSTKRGRPGGWTTSFRLPSAVCKKEPRACGPDLMNLELGTWIKPEEKEFPAAHEAQLVYVDSAAIVSADHTYGESSRTDSTAEPPAKKKIKAHSDDFVLFAVQKNLLSGPETSSTPSTSDDSVVLVHLCRVCARQIEDATVEAISVFGEEAAQLRLLDIIKDHLPIQMPRRDDRLPPLICRGCVSRLQVCDEVSQLAAASEDTLRHLLGLRRLRHLTNKTKLTPINDASTGDEDDDDPEPRPRRLAAPSRTRSSPHKPPPMLPAIASDSDAEPEEPIVTEEPSMWSSNSQNLPAPSSNVSNHIKCSLCDITGNTPKLMKLHYYRVHNKEMCKFCYECFDSIDACVKHCHNNHRQACLFCGFYFLDKEKLISHVHNIHFDKLPKFIQFKYPVKEAVNCTLCKGIFTSKVSAKKHYFREHFQYACDICLELFPKSEEQLDHTNRVHLIPCPHCAENFYSQRKMMEHRKTVHPGTSSLPFPTPPKLSQYIFQCKNCGKGLSSKVDLKRHNLWGHTKYTCDFCLGEFATMEEEEAHFEQIHGKKKCYYCVKIFEHSNLLISHMKSQHAQKELFCCDSCGKILEDRIELRRHRILHTIKPVTFSCKECEKPFADKSSLATHLTQHHNPRGFRCKECNKIFAHQSQLQSHIKKHNHVNIFKCLDCGAAYSRASSLQNHVLVHDPSLKSFGCGTCKMRFYEKPSLLDHVKTVHGDVTLFRCLQCQRCLTTEDGMMAHLATHRLEMDPLSTAYEKISALRCEFCTESFENKTKLISHIFTTHLKCQTRKKKMEKKKSLCK